MRILRTSTDDQAALARMLLIAAPVALTLGLASAHWQFQNYAVAVAVLVLVAGVFMQSPAVALLAFIVVRPVIDAFVDRSVGGFSLGEVWGIGLIAAALVYLLSQPDVRIPAAPLALLLAYLVLTVMRSETGMVISTSLKLASWALFAVAIEKMSSTREGQVTVLNAMSLSAIVLVSTMALVAAQGRFGSAYYGFAEASGGYTPPHALARLAVLILPFLLAQVIAERKLVLSFTLSALVGLGIIYSFVRSAWVTTLAVLGGYLFAMRGGRALIARLNLVLIVAVVTVAVYSSWRMIEERLIDIPILGRMLGIEDPVYLEYLGGAGRGRVRFWQLLLAKGTDSVSHFLFGRGAGATFQIGAEDLGASLWAHNDFVELFITGGVILAGAYVILLGWIFATIVQLRRDPGQSRKVRSFCSLAFGALAGYVLISSTDGVIMAAGGVVMAAFVGLIGGMRQTPGSTFLDHSDTATAASYDDVATGRDRRRSPSPWRRTA